MLSSLDKYEVSAFFFLLNVCVVDVFVLQRMLICDTLEPIEYEDGTVILRQGEVGHSFFLIVSGQVRVLQRVGDLEGEVGLLGEGNKEHLSFFFASVLKMICLQETILERLRC